MNDHIDVTEDESNPIFAKFKQVWIASNPGIEFEMINPFTYAQWRGWIAAHLEMTAAEALCHAEVLFASAEARDEFRQGSLFPALLYLRNLFDASAPLVEALFRLQISSCDCLTKTPEFNHHAENCRYRVATEALHKHLFLVPTVKATVVAD